MPCLPHNAVSFRTNIIPYVAILRAHLKRLFFVYWGFGGIYFRMVWFVYSQSHKHNCCIVVSTRNHQVPFQDYYYDATTNPGGHKGLDYANAEGTPVYAQFRYSDSC